MRALILVGGYGTRLRPLTFNKPKPLVEFCNKPIVIHQIEALVKIGVTEIILAVNVQPQTMLDFLKECENKYHISIHCSQEDVPLGTAGPLALARQYLGADDELFFMFNSDVICEFPLQKMITFHKNHGREGTLLVTPVKDPSKYGVVVYDEDGKIDRFHEKPKEFIGDKINAGMYLFSPKVLNRIELKPTSIERDVFPVMAAQGELYAMVLAGYWMDIGQPKDYLRGMVLHLASMDEKSRTQPENVEIRGNVLIDPSATFGNGCVIGPDVVVGPNVVVGDGVRMERTTILDGAHIKNHASIKSSLIGWRSTVGKWCRLSEVICGLDVTFVDEISAFDVVVCPHKGVKENVLSPRIIL